MADTSDDNDIDEEKLPLNEDDSEEKATEMKPTAGNEEEQEEKDDESNDDIQMTDIYFIEVIDKQQKDKRGPFTFSQFKGMYREQTNKGLTYMSPVWNGMEISEWTQLYKLDIFKDVDPEKYDDLQNKKPKNK